MSSWFALTSRTPSSFLGVFFPGHTADLRIASPDDRVVTRARVKGWTNVDRSNLDQKGP